MQEERNEGSPSRPHKKQHYAPLIKPNYPLPNTVAGLQGCIEPPCICSEVDVASCSSSSVGGTADCTKQRATS